MPYHGRIANTSKNIPSEKWLEEELWNKVKLRLPIATLDVIFERDGKILYGYRRIAPYRNVWAFIGGRILFGEGLVDSVQRISSEYGLRPRKAYLVGVFPITFKSRSDVAIAIAALEIDGEPQVDGYEFSSFVWRETPPKRLGVNYRRMLEKWGSIRKSEETLRLMSLYSERSALSPNNPPRGGHGTA
jgi:ADP-ribose pyrophosphatase YjhB (NUDIX family)